MELRTKAELIRTFPEKWKQVFHFFRGNKWSGDDEEIYTQLLTLPENRTEQQLKDITGEIGERWLENRCNGCRQDVATVVVLGPVEEGPQCQVCPQCLGAALNLAQTPETSNICMGRNLNKKPAGDGPIVVWIDYPCTPGVQGAGEG